MLLITYNLSELRAHTCFKCLFLCIYYKANSKVKYGIVSNKKMYICFSSPKMVKKITFALITLDKCE